jgi:hypothetical protein
LEWNGRVKEGVHMVLVLVGMAARVLCYTNHIAGLSFRSK